MTTNSCLPRNTTALLRRMLATAGSSFSSSQHARPVLFVRLSDGTPQRTTLPSRIRWPPHPKAGMATEDLRRAVRPCTATRRRATRGRGPKKHAGSFSGKKMQPCRRAPCLPACQLHSPSSSMPPTRRWCTFDAIGPRARAPRRVSLLRGHGPSRRRRASVFSELACQTPSPQWRACG